MRVLGFNITREKAAGNLSRPNDRGGWWQVIKESFTGAWQRNIEVKFDSVLAFHADFSCRTLIASDIAKLRIKLVKQDSDGVWSEIKKKPFSDVLARPNHYQNRIQFMENWVLSKLQNGNTYVLKQRNERGQVVRLYVLDPNLVTPLISDDGSVFYQMNTDKLAGVAEQIIVPAREIIHDRFNCFYHPLVGLSPIFAGGLAAMQGLAIQNDSAAFFQNGAQPGGVLTAPGEIQQATAERLKQHWESEYSGKNAGKVAVLGDGLKYEAMRAKSTDSQLIEQLKWSAEVVCSVYHVPPYKAGVGSMPTNNNVQSLNIEYYTQCLQVLIESIELCLDEGLGTGEGVGTDFDTDNLLRMDTATQMDVLDKAKSVLTLDERRRRLEMPKLPTGGNTVYLQQQDHSIEAIAARDRQLIDGVDNPVVIPANDNMTEEADKAMIEILRGFSQ
ncbi:phage portal protein [Brucella gallinifaecis]|uniref:Phage portal protein n=1 Tax=Brucella gallinifaecis TaxID=215590 RepID=A0A502BSE2_9HYPH|nr:phage portal protein [Brucella gallinifaecis]TPF76730.1 phage portal protein [Brucella gallinifaecis]